jgi:hypothetical protein
MNKTILIALFSIVSICRVSLSASDQHPQQLITYQFFVISSDHPIQHDFAKIKNYKGVRILNTSTGPFRSDRETNIDINKMLYPQYVDGHKEQKPILIGISIALTGKFANKGKITLIGKMTSTEADVAKTSPEKTSLETVSSDLYFSAITTSGSEVWFDVDRLFLRTLGAIPIPREENYHALRIIPTLVSSKTP